MVVFTKVDESPLAWYSQPAYVFFPVLFLILLWVTLTEAKVSSLKCTQAVGFVVLMEHDVFVLCSEHTESKVLSINTPRESQEMLPVLLTQTFPAVYNLQAILQTLLLSSWLAVYCICLKICFLFMRNTG